MRFFSMIFSTESGRMLISILSGILLLTASCSSGGAEEGAAAPFRKVFINSSMRSFTEGSEDYSIRADSAFQSDSSDNLLMKKVVFMKFSQDDTVRIVSDSCINGDSEIVFMGRVRVDMKDSMQIFTEAIVYMSAKDSAMSEDSLLIRKSGDKLKTKGFISDGSFKRVDFPNPVIISDD